MSESLFTSESVAAGHPDKMADQISDAVLDAALQMDPNARVACETLIKEHTVVVAGEITSRLYPDIVERIGVEGVVRRVARAIGYVGPEWCFDADNCKILTLLNKQSSNIAAGVDKGKESDQGAGDQGLMFGYATDETEVYMPQPITYAHHLMQRHAEVRKDKLRWLGPDAKSQVTLRYVNGVPTTIDTVVVSTQHSEEKSLKEVREAVREEIIVPVLGAQQTADAEIKINTAGRFVTGGPVADCGLTGRKIIVDTYGGMARHGGGAFSGKDPSKVDRSAAYAARHVAKNLVAAGLAKRCEVQLSYAIGVAEPVSISFYTQGTGRLPDTDMRDLVEKHFNLTPDGIIKALDLKRPIYESTATYGHFGRQESTFTWESLNKQDVLRSSL